MTIASEVMSPVPGPTKVCAADSPFRAIIETGELPVDPAFRVSNVASPPRCCRAEEA